MQSGLNKINSQDLRANHKKAFNAFTHKTSTTEFLSPKIFGVEVVHVKLVKFLQLILDSKLDFNEHIKHKSLLLFHWVDTIPFFRRK